MENVYYLSLGLGYNFTLMLRIICIVGLGYVPVYFRHALFLCSVSIDLYKQ